MKPSEQQRTSQAEVTVARSRDVLEASNTLDKSHSKLYDIIVVLTTLFSPLVPNHGWSLVLLMPKALLCTLFQSGFFWIFLQSPGTFRMILTGIWIFLNISVLDIITI